ncbi:MAG: cellulose synthase operon protein YhjQ/BcsQ, partial [Terracidiphilus sp.]
AGEEETAVADEKSSLPAPWLADIQDADIPDGQSAVEENIAVPAPSWEPETDQGGSMWQTVTDGREALSKAPRLAGEAAQAAQDGNASRWFVLKGMLGGAQAPETSEPTGDAPVLEVFSLAGGVGKTSLVATLGRALSARGERVLLVEATPLASLQYYFGACDSHPGTIRTFRPPASSGDAPIQLATLDTEAQEPNSAAPGSLATDIQRWAAGASRVIVDVGTGSIAAVRALAKLSPVVLVPLIPDVNSVVTAKTIDSFFQRQIGASGGQSMVCYLLNQFDSSLPLHVDVRNVLREQLRERLLPFALERTPAVSEALAEGMTIMDYAPDSRITADFTNLADWLEKVLAPAKLDSHGRWSER